MISTYLIFDFFSSTYESNITFDILYFSVDSSAIKAEVFTENLHQ